MPGDNNTGEIVMTYYCCHGGEMQRCCHGRFTLDNRSDLIAQPKRDGELVSEDILVNFVERDIRIHNIQKDNICRRNDVILLLLWRRIFGFHGSVNGLV